MIKYGVLVVDGEELEEFEILLGSPDFIKKLSRPPREICNLFKRTEGCGWFG